MNEKITFLSGAINITSEYLKTLPEVADKGSCNLDTVIVDFTGWRQKDIESLSLITGLNVGDKMTGWSKGYRFVFFKTSGQAYANTFLVESACKKLKELGVSSASVWYQLD